MKKIISICFLSIFSIFYSQKKNAVSKEIIFSPQKYIFHSGNNGQEKEDNFSILQNQEELNKAMNIGNFYMEGSVHHEERLVFPKNQKVILYNFGEFSSGDHRPKGIYKLKLTEDTLEVYLINSHNDLRSTEISIQVVTNPYMIFSIPEEFNFKNIIIK